ncbi:MAG TPA: universal stress protein [Blastocatellia bacterium]|nr:universal stress protein [Blastocatellia bacterium]HMV87504.1 universal stress protein [Blastocatellia bacterium]HMX30129.1 universal stress protein [Blastocatellia bacterium]HMY73957.1 universal stress protein [Blastocatellia bacterium]HMZ22644.1 universal stress protein [Blastocatellia bacterium]
MKDKTKILIAYDGSECADAALADLKLAGFPRKVEAYVLSVHAEWVPAPTSFGMVDTDFARYIEESEKEALAMARRARATLKLSFPDWEIHAEAATGSPAKLILHKADDLNADLIVVGSHGRSALGRLLLGSVSQKILHAAHSTVRIARGRQLQPAAPIRLIVGVDGSKGAEAAVKAVAARHWPKGSEARIVNGFPVVPALGMEYAATAIAQWIADEKARVGVAIESAADRLRGAGLAVSTAMKETDARYSLLNEAESWKADCIFVGAKGMNSIERFLLGSVSSYVATHAPCSVEVIREEG